MGYSMQVNSKIKKIPFLVLVSGLVFENWVYEYDKLFPIGQNMKFHYCVYILYYYNIRDYFWLIVLVNNLFCVKIIETKHFHRYNIPLTVIAVHLYRAMTSWVPNDLYSLPYKHIYVKNSCIDTCFTYFNCWTQHKNTSKSPTLRLANT